MKSSVLYAAIVLLSAFVAFGCSDDKTAPAPKTYKLGDVYQQNGVKGVVYEVSDDGLHGMIVSLDEITAAWSTQTVSTGATDVSDGAKNQAVIEALANWQNLYPAFAWCAAKNVGGVTGWFMPAFDQLADLYDVYAADPVAFNAFLTKNGGTPILTETEANYWSSSENLVAGREEQAALLDFATESFGFGDKTNANRVRAVRAF